MNQNNNFTYTLRRVDLKFQLISLHKTLSFLNIFVFIRIFVNCCLESLGESFFEVKI